VTSYPNFAGKHAEEAIFTPADFAAYLGRIGALSDYRPPAGVVLCYQQSLYQHVLRAEGLEDQARRGALFRVLPLPSTDGRIGLLGRIGIGAPAAVAAMEDLAAMGTSAFVSVGSAGSLQRDLNVGDLVLCESAIRDEGVSHHYLPAAKLSKATPDLTAALRIASAFVVSDSLADLVWNPQFHTPQVEVGLITLYQAALAALQPDPVRG
jgi:uridine phosphorylase